MPGSRPTQENQRSSPRAMSAGRFSAARVSAAPSSAPPAAAASMAATVAAAQACGVAAAQKPRASSRLVQQRGDRRASASSGGGMPWHRAATPAATKCRIAACSRRYRATRGEPSSVTRMPTGSRWSDSRARSSDVAWSPGAPHAAAAKARLCEGGTSVSRSPCTSNTRGAAARGGSRRSSETGHAAAAASCCSPAPGAAGSLAVWPNLQSKFGTAS
mmetsp:Transcript_38407/g.127186  ORF Transcript_38407/g.127186 Transcript_38407/m.127186 type:complete len:217 (-) Transcript_38407:730-1380(-)